MEATGYGGRVWNRGPLRHMLGRLSWFWCGEKEGMGRGIYSVSV